MFCTSCGRQLRENARFCRSCGAPTALLRREPEIRIRPAASLPEGLCCEYCGEPLEGQPVFCDNCGGRVLTLKRD